MIPPCSRCRRERTTQEAAVYQSLCEDCHIDHDVVAQSRASVDRRMALMKNCGAPRARKEEPNEPPTP